MDGLAFYDQYTDELEHFGILGQKWGHKNGPPYPLDDDDHSASEEKAGWKKSLSEAAGNVSSAVKKKTEEIKVKRAEKAAQNEEKKKLKEEAKEQKRLEDEAAAADKHLADKNAAVRSGDPLLVAQFASEMSIQEYREAVDRLNLANTVNKYMPEPETKKTMLQRVNDFADKTQEKVNTYNKIARLTNTFFKTDLPILDESALDRAEKKLKKEEEKKEKEVKKQVDAAQNAYKIANAQKSMRDLEETEARRDRDRMIRDWQDQVKVSAAKETLAKNAEAAKNREKAEADRRKAEQDQEMERARYAADYENRMRDARKEAYKDGENSPSAIKDRFDWMREQDAAQRIDAYNQSNTQERRDARRDEEERVAFNSMPNMSNTRLDQIEREGSSFGKKTYSETLDDLANSTNVANLRFDQIESEGYSSSAYNHGVKSYNQALEDWAKESG